MGCTLVQFAGDRSGSTLHMDAQQEPKMRVADVCRIVITLAGASMAISLAVDTADAAAGRNSAVQRCMAEARASTDVNQGAVFNQRRQTAIYRSCMQQAGFRP